MVAAEGVVEWLRAVFWRRQSVSLVAINCEPGQVRKEAAAAIDSSAGVGLAGAVSSDHSAGIDHMRQDPVSARIGTV